MEYIIQPDDTKAFMNAEKAWTEEYPEAKKFTDLERAKSFLNSFLKKSGEIGKFYIVQDYGLDTESDAYEVGVVELPTID